MNNSVKYIFYIFISVIILSFASCENNIAVVNTITSETQKKLAIESDDNVQIMYSDSARVRAILTAPILNRYAEKKPYMEMPKGMEVIFYDANKKEQTKLTADYGIGFNNPNGEMEHMEAKRNVVVINKKGDTLNTEHLIWNAVTQKIYTNEFVKITTKDEIILGDGLIANQDFSDYTIKNVKGRIDVKDEQEKKANNKSKK